MNLSSNSGDGLVVIDCSLMIELLLVSEPGIDAEMRLRRDARKLVAPDLLSIEVISALKKLRLRRVIGSADANFHFKRFRTFKIEYFGHAPLAPRVWQLQDNFSPYDATYVALAESLHAPLWTSDRRLAQACDGIISAEFFGDLTQTA